MSKIQRAVIQLDDAAIDRDELSTATYGDSTANAVLGYKKKRNIINRSYQNDADNITGVMTMASLDKELVAKEATAADFIFLSDSQRTTVAADLQRSRQMLDVSSIVCASSRGPRREAACWLRRAMSTTMIRS